MYHYASGSNGAVVADCHAGEDADVCSDPHVVAHGDGMCIFQSGVAQVGFQWMSGGVESAVGSYENVFSECDGCFIEDDKIYVGVEVFADVDIVAVVAIERLLYEKLLACRAKDVTQESCALIGAQG